MKRAIACIPALLWPAAAHACAVCFSGSDRTRIAFLLTTIVMSLLPLGMIAGGLLWLRREARRRAGAEDLAPTPGARPAPALDPGA